MALKLTYVLKETGGNLRRNLLMSSAAILTVAVSLALVGGALLLRQGVSNATVQWRGGTELSIFMKPDAPQSQIDAVATELGASPEVERFNFVDKPAAYAEAQTLFANEPDTLASLSVNDMPPSFRIVPTRAEFIESLGARYTDDPGVRAVTYAKEAIQTMLTVTRVLQAGLIVVAAVLLGSAALLILNTIRIAIFARRREVSVMKLVGATNWFIRIPFMLEGLLQGLLGAGIAFLAVLGIRIAMGRVANSNNYQLLQQLVVTPDQAIGTGILVLLIGTIVGVVGSLVAVHRFLDT